MKGRAAYPSVEQRSDGKLVMHYGSNAAYPVIEPIFDVERRIREMDRAGVDAQVITLNIPGVDRVEPELGLKLARLVNNDFAKLGNRYPNRFIPFAAIPFQAPELAIDELRRAIDSLGLKGLMLYSNVNGKPLDSADLMPIYAECNKRHTPIFIHPTYPANTENMMDYCLIPVVGFLFDTTLAALRLIQGGILESYPELTFVLGHLGSTIPYLIGRIDQESSRLPGCNSKITELPGSYFKKFFIDTVSAHKPAMISALSYPGIDRIVFGSDYPYWEQEWAISLINSLELNAQSKELIFGENARKILNI
jgi:aminocarboxymuconate-semialdehyde decarboxylase